MCSLQWVNKRTGHHVTRLVILSGEPLTDADAQAVQDLVQGYMDYQLNPAIINIGPTEKRENKKYKTIKELEELADLAQLESLSTTTTDSPETAGGPLGKQGSHSPGKPQVSGGKYMDASDELKKILRGPSKDTPFYQVEEEKEE